MFPQHYQNAALEADRILRAAGADDENFRPDLAPDDIGPEYFGRDHAGRDFVGNDEVLGWSPFKAISHAVSSIPVVGQAVHAATTLPRVGLKIAQGQNVGRVLQAEAPQQLQALAQIARGGNVLTVAKGQGAQIVNDRRQMIRDAAQRSAFVPGVGTATATALTTAAALSEGRGFAEAAKQGALAALPGSPLVQNAVSTGFEIARGRPVFQALARGGLNYAKTQVPLSQALTAALPLAAQLTNSPMVQMVKNGAALTFGSNVPPSAAIATMSAITQAAASTDPNIAAAAKQVIANTRDLAATGHPGAEVAHGAIQQALASNLALRQAKNRLIRR